MAFKKLGNEINELLVPKFSLAVYLYWQRNMDLGYTHEHALEECAETHVVIGALKDEIYDHLEERINMGRERDFKAFCSLHSHYLYDGESIEKAVEL